MNGCAGLSWNMLELSLKNTGNFLQHLLGFASGWKCCNEAQAWPPKSLSSLPFYCLDHSFDSVSVSQCPVRGDYGDPQVGPYSKAKQEWNQI